MKQRWKKITAVMLVIVIVLGMIPNTAVTAHAEEAATEEQAVGSSTDGISGMTEEENTTESIMEETTTEELTTEVGTTEQKTESEPDSLEKEAGEAEKTTKQTETTESPSAPKPDTADTEQEKDQTEFRTVEKYTLYCMQDTRVYQMADTASAVLEELTAGDLFTVTAETDAWYRIIYGTEEETGYSGYDAFRIATALNYFKSKNGGRGGKKDYGLVQQVIWNTGSSDLSTYIKHAWKLADNNGNRSSGSGSFDSKLKAVTGVTSESGRREAAESLTSQKVTNTDGVISKTVNLSGSAWKYFAKGSFGTGISVMGVYDKDGKAVSYDKKTNYVGTDGKLHIKIPTNDSTGFGHRTFA